MPHVYGEGGLTRSYALFLRLQPGKEDVKSISLHRINQSGLGTPSAGDRAARDRRYFCTRHVAMEPCLGLRKMPPLNFFYILISLSSQLS